MLTSASTRFPVDSTDAALQPLSPLPRAVLPPLPPPSPRTVSLLQQGGLQISGAEAVPEPAAVSVQAASAFLDKLNVPSNAIPSKDRNFPVDVLTPQQAASGAVSGSVLSASVAAGLTTSSRQDTHSSLAPSSSRSTPPRSAQPPRASAQPSLPQHVLPSVSASVAESVAGAAASGRVHTGAKSAVPRCDRLRCRSRRQLPASPPGSACACACVRLRGVTYAYACTCACAYAYACSHVRRRTRVRRLDILGGRTSNPSKGVASLERPSVPVYLLRWPVPELGQYSQRSLPAVVRSGMCPLSE